MISTSFDPIAFTLGALAATAVCVLAMRGIVCSALRIVRRKDAIIREMHADLMQARAQCNRAMELWAMERTKNWAQAEKADPQFTPDDPDWWKK